MWVPSNSVFSVIPDVSGLVCRDRLHECYKTLSFCICWKVGRLCRGIWIGWIDGPHPALWHSARLNAGSCTWVTTTPCRWIGLGKSAWKVVWLRRTWGCCQQRVEHEPALCSGGQEGQVASGPASEMAWPAGQGT